MIEGQPVTTGKRWHRSEKNKEDGGGQDGRVLRLDCSQSQREVKSALIGCQSARSRQVKKR